MKFLIFLFMPAIGFAQNGSLNMAGNDSAKNVNSTLIKNYSWTTSNSKIKPGNFIIPGVLITYGALATKNKSFEKINIKTRDEIREDHPFFHTGIDNYSQFVPGVAVFVLNAFGVKGKSSLNKEAIVYAMSLGINTAIVFPLKKISHQERPDGSNFQSFPSGHTSTAFASAEFLRREYGDDHPWIAIGGYAIAAGTGVLRMYNNKHWLCDVVAGAGVGILSTTVSYWLYDKLHIGGKGDKEHQAFIFPGYNNKQFNLGLVKQF